ncbi:MAG TPA: hypothetical protein VNR11_05390 [Xanthobacteraceae bacterium]|nr:hypothetical protein [Xanthobacteraceae bacterium]
MFLSLGAISLAAVPLTAHLVVTVADDVPTFNVEPSCRAAASVAGATQDRLQTCMASEERARDQAKQQWSAASAADRSLCSRTAQAGGIPTYTELLTCLEMARDTRSPPTVESLAPVTEPATSGMAHRQPRPAQPPANPE